MSDGFDPIAFELFKNKAGRLVCTLACYRGAGHEGPWLIVTDLAPELARATWYGLRGWIEQGFKRVKGEGWNLPRTRVSGRPPDSPPRARSRIGSTRTCASRRSSSDGPFSGRTPV